MRHDPGMLPISTASDVWLPEFVYSTLNGQLPGVGDRIYPAGSVPIGTPGPYLTQEQIASVGLSDLTDFEGHAYEGTLQIGVFSPKYSDAWKIARQASRLLAESAPAGLAALSNFLTSDLGKDPDTGLNYVAIRCDFLETHPAADIEYLFVNGDFVGVYTISVNGEPVTQRSRRRARDTSAQLPGARTRN